MKTKTNLLSSGLLASVLCLLCACTTTAQVPPANSVEVKQRNAAGDGWEFVSLTPQPDSALTFGTDRKPGTTTLVTFARASDLTLLNSSVGTLQTQLTTNTGKITTAESNITALQTSVAGKENTGIAASLLSAHTAAANPHTQYALASVLANYATLTVLNSAMDSLTTAINMKAPLTHTHAQTDITGLAAALVAKVDTSDTRLHTHTNKSTLDKITESAGLPLWNGATWPGGSTGGSYTLPPATATTLGGIKVGANLSITADGTLSAASGGAGLPLTGNGVGIANPTEGNLAISAEFFDTNSSDLTTIRSQTRTEIFANETIKLQSNEGITLVSHGGQFLFNAEALMDFRIDDTDGGFSFNRHVSGVPAVSGNDFVTKAQLDAATSGLPNITGHETPTGRTFNGAPTYIRSFNFHLNGDDIMDNTQVRASFIVSHGGGYYFDEASYRKFPIGSYSSFEDIKGDYQTHGGSMFYIEDGWLCFYKDFFGAITVHGWVEYTKQ